MESRQGFPPARECEAEAVVAGNVWPREQGMHRVVIETVQVVQLALCNPIQDRAEFGDLITKGRQLLESQSRYEVKFIRRSGNAVAYALV
ncbi:hypothetical protein LINPERHAP1_LOCUS31907 [Linum perenne]